MRNRKTYLFSLIICILIGVSSFLYIKSKSPELINYWGTDFINEIYIHDYSTDKLFIQLYLLSISFVLSILLLLIFNIKRNIAFYSILSIGCVLFILLHLTLSVDNTDSNLSELGAVDLGN